MRQKKFNITKEKLYELYWKEGLNLRQIGRKFNISRQPVWIKMIGYKIRRRTTSECRLGKHGIYSKKTIEKMRKTRKKPEHIKRFNEIMNRPEIREKSRIGNIGKHKGEKNSNWKGGIASLNNTIRTSLEYKQWIKNVFERDKFTCLGCGKNGGNLEAHHKKACAKILKENNIKNFEEALNCKILWNIQNGMTLCPKCHSQIDKFRRIKIYNEVEKF